MRAYRTQSKQRWHVPPVYTEENVSSKVVKTVPGFQLSRQPRIVWHSVLKRGWLQPYLLGYNLRRALRNSR
jgi:hypothetical protein